MSFDINSGPVISTPLITSLPAFESRVSVLRLDTVHPVISGNKWYKLSGYLHQAGQHQLNAVVTFGGAYSNHIVATAAACRQAGLLAHGIIRGEEPRLLSPTLQDARSFGMELHFCSREDYRQKLIPESLKAITQSGSCLVINEGGYGVEGTSGISLLAKELSLHRFSHILCAVGTGTTLAGLVLSAPSEQQIIGVPVLKNAGSLEAAIKRLLPEKLQNGFTLLNQFHFGGYARSIPELFSFMNQWYRHTGIPSDFVYTGKMFYAFTQLWQQGFFPPDARILLVHTGGMQGNRSLSPGTLIF